MEPTDVTIEILKSIRDEVRGTNARLDAHDGRLAGIDQRIDRLHQRQVETEVRLATELVSVVGAIHEVRDELRADRELRARVDDHERRIERLETRTG